MLSAKKNLQYAQVLSSAVLYWLIEQISYFLPSYSCNYPLAQKQSAAYGLRGRCDILRLSGFLGVNGSGSTCQCTGLTEAVGPRGNWF